MFISQYGDKYTAYTIKDLKEQVWPWKVFKIYQDKKDGSTVHTWYGIGSLWFNMFIPLEILV